MMRNYAEAEVIPTEFIEALESEAFTDFLHQINRSDKSLFSVTLPVAGIDPLAALELHPGDQEKFYWEHPENFISISAGGRIRELKATGTERFRSISEQTATLRGEIQAYTAVQHSMAGPLFLGGYSFADHNVSAAWKKFGAARFILPEWMLLRHGSLHLLTLTIEKGNRDAGELYQDIIAGITNFLNLAGLLQSSKLPRPRDHTILCTLQNPDERENWIRKVNRAKKGISEKHFEKLVLARSVAVESKHRPEPTIMNHRLRQKFPECYHFMIRQDSETTFMGATPERLASFRNGVFLTEGLAGSTSRGESALEDETLAHSLLKSRKDREEHAFVVRSIDDSLKSFTDKVDHPQTPRIKKLENVQHLFTPISASIREGVDIHELIRELHPTPAVGGFPKKESVAYLQDIEQMERGWYAAPVGWYNLKGSGEFAVAIRSALLHGRKAFLYAGCGIVADSDPEKEWDETLLKFKPMLEALQVS